MAAALAASLPADVRRAARSTEWAPEVLFYTLLDRDEALREEQLLIIAQRMGAESEAQVRALVQAAGLPAAAQRLPLLEIAFPALKRHPPQFVTRVLETAKALTSADGRVDVFEFLLARVITQHLWESYNPDRVRLSGNRRLEASRDEAQRVLAILARHGSEDDAAAAAAYRAGCDALGFDAGAGLPPAEDWAADLDSALPVLDQLKPADKARLVDALASVVLHDGRMLPSELELLRVTCDLIHVPLPLLVSAQD
jgi:hypothetical protein